MSSNDRAQLAGSRTGRPGELLYEPTADGPRALPNPDPIRRLVDFLESEAAGARAARWGAGHALACSFLARCLAEMGKFPEALAFGHRGLARAEQLGNPFHVATACLGLGGAYLRRADSLNAIAQLRRGLALMEAHDIGIFLPATSASLGLALVGSGQTTEGLALLDRAVERARFMSISASCAKFMAYRGEGSMLAGQIAARDRRECGHEAMALRLLGDVVAREDGEDGRQAEGLYMEALAWVCKLEMRPLAALCHMSLGILLAEHSRREQGSAHLAQAVEMLQQMDMKFWLKSATDYRSVRANR